MSFAKRQLEERKKKPAARRYGNAGPVELRIKWSFISHANLLELIDIVTETGGALRLGSSRDGGALALGVYGDGPEPYTLYSPSIEGMEDHIAGLYAAFEAIKLEQLKGD